MVHRHIHTIGSIVDFVWSIFASPPEAARAPVSGQVQQRASLSSEAVKRSPKNAVSPSDGRPRGGALVAPPGKPGYSAAGSVCGLFRGDFLEILSVLDCSNGSFKLIHQTRAYRQQIRCFSVRCPARSFPGGPADAASNCAAF